MPSPDRVQIDFGDLLIAVAHELDDIRQCIACGSDSTWVGLWLSDEALMSVSAWCDAAACERDRTVASAGRVLAAPIEHLAALRRITSRPGPEADERARIVWWLRAGVVGPASVNTDPIYLQAAAELADVIEQHPERFANAPTGGVR